MLEARIICLGIVNDNEMMLDQLIKSLFKSKATRLQEYLSMAEQLIQAEEMDSAGRLLDELVETYPDCGSAWYLRGTLHRQQGDSAHAHADLERALALMPDNVNCLYELAVSLLMRGDTGAAAQLGRKARRLAPDETRVFAMLAKMEMPGEFYFSVLQRIFGLLQPRTYVEIGVFKGDSLKLAHSAKMAIGIDPEPRIDGPLDSHMRVHAMTSDDFFARHDLKVELGNRPVDLGFIDGLHLFEYALRDFVNLERNCHRNSVILIHDCYPIDETCASRDLRSVNWCGDVWRLILLLRKYRPDLHISTIATAPSGLAVIRNLNPESTLLQDRLESLSREFLALDFEHLNQDKAGKLNVVANDWQTVQATLRSTV